MRRDTAFVGYSSGLEPRHSRDPASVDEDRSVVVTPVEDVRTTAGAVSVTPRRERGVVAVAKPLRAAQVVAFELSATGRSWPAQWPRRVGHDHLAVAGGGHVAHQTACG